MTQPSENDVQRITESGWVSLLPAELRSTIVQSCAFRSVAKGHVLWHSGDAVSGLYLILSGCLRAETSQTRHGPAMLHIFHAPSWIGEAEILAATGRITTMTALRECSLMFLPLPKILNLAGRYPELWRGLGYLAADHLYVAVAAMNDLMIRSSADRLAAVLLRLCGARVPAFTGVTNTDLDVTQAELGQLCNLSRSVVADILGQFEQDGIVRMAYGHLTILDVESLADKAGVTLAPAASG